jgi:AAHS family 4-hydroxybenzoate transporter-like MFS transporter
MATRPKAVGTESFSGFHLRIVLLCGLVAMLDGFDTQAIAYVAPRIASDWSLPPSSFGPVFGIGLLGLALGAFVFSPVADRFGRKRIILLSVLIFGLFALLTAQAATFGQLLLLRFLTGLGLGGAMPNIIALTNEHSPDRLKATLVTIMFCGFPLGSTLGGFVVAPLIAEHGWRWVFVAGGLMPLAALPLLAWLLPESPAIRGRIDSVEASSGRAPVLALFDEGRAAMTMLLWTAFFMNLLVMYFLVNWLPSLLASTNIGLKAAILSTALLNLGGIVGGVIIGRLIDGRSPFLILGGAYAIGGCSIAVIAFATPWPALLLLAAVVAGFGIVGAQIGINAVSAASYPAAMRVTGVGWALGVGRIGSIIGPTAGGFLLGLGWSVQSLLLTAVIPALLASCAVFALRFLVREPGSR